VLRKSLSRDIAADVSGTLRHIAAGKGRKIIGNIPPAVMAGLVPAIHVLHVTAMAGGYVNLLASAPNGVLYVGVTNNLVRRIYEHRNGLIAGFTKKYSVKRLVYFERHEDIQAAIQREHNIKHWSRKWKVRLILVENPEWDDLYEKII
jgi:putative endonuclease